MRDWTEVQGQRYIKEEHFSVPANKHHHQQLLELENGIVSWTHSHEDGDRPHRHGVSFQITKEIAFANEGKETDEGTTL